MRGKNGNYVVGIYSWGLLSISSVCAISFIKKKTCEAVYWYKHILLHMYPEYVFGIDCKTDFQAVYISFVK